MDCIYLFMPSPSRPLDKQHSAWLVFLNIRLHRIIFVVTLCSIPWHTRLPPAIILIPELLHLLLFPSNFMFIDWA